MSIETATEQPFGSLARQANKLMDQMQKGFYAYSNESWTPNVNLYETANSYLVCVDLAGVEKEKIDVEVQDQRLRLRGTRVVPRFDDVGEVAVEPSDAADDAPRDPPPWRVRIHLMEIDHGPFAREVELPSDANRERITATHRNGLLWIEIPRGEAG